MAKVVRPGKVFVDWSQNNRHKTTVAVYSLRARPDPTVSTPVSWEEVASCAEGDVELGGDPLGDLRLDLLGRVVRIAVREHRGCAQCRQRGCDQDSDGFHGD